MENLTEITAWIQNFIDRYQVEQRTETHWLKPIVGVAAANDPLYADIKQSINPTHKLPEEITPGAKSVIVYFVPFDREIALSNISGEESSRQWDYAYIETNNMLSELSAYLYRRLTELGYRASNLPPTYNYDLERLLCDWSHRSSAYIAGIGKFGLNNMLITKSGCCGRLGSVITDLELPATPRSQDEYCLQKAGRACGKCLKKCVGNAFEQTDGNISFDRFKCNYQIYEKIVPHYPIGDGDACGKCLCGLPCSFVNPMERA